MTNLPLLRDFDDRDFNPFMSDEIVTGSHLDPYPRIAELRAQGEVLEGDYRTTIGLYPDITQPQEAPRFMALGYNAVQKALQTPQIFGNHAYTFNIGLAFGRSVSIMDAPEHTRYRRIFQKIFLPQFVREWGTTIVDPAVDELMNAFLHTGKADLVQQFTLLFPFNVIYKQLDLPTEQGKMFHKLAIAQTLAYVDREHAVEASQKLGEFFTALIAERRKNPGDDLCSLLVQVESEGERLPDDVLVSFFRQLVNAAGDTTYRATSVMLTKLLENPEQLEALRADRSLMNNAIEESLRFDGPVLYQDRWANVDTELGGLKIPAGSIVQVVAGAANRDPSVFPDPDKFDIRRANAARHFSFSQGPHICIGQHLARIEITRALSAILDRLPNLRLDPDMPPPQIKGAMMRVPHHIHVRFDPA